MKPVLYPYLIRWNLSQGLQVRLLKPQMLWPLFWIFQQRGQRSWRPSTLPKHQSGECCSIRRLLVQEPMVYQCKQKQTFVFEFCLHFGYFYSTNFVLSMFKILTSNKYLWKLILETNKDKSVYFKILFSDISNLILYSFFVLFQTLMSNDVHVGYRSKNPTTTLADWLFYDGSNLGTCTPTDCTTGQG